MKKFIIPVLLLVSATAEANIQSKVHEAPATSAEKVALPAKISLFKKPKTNVIYLIGDGMGVAFTSAYRYYQNTSATKVVNRSIFDEMLVGMASTYPDDEVANVTDSAAAATALATSVKTYNGAIGVDRQRNQIPSLLDAAKEKGYMTGIAVTSQINHATPAAFVAHVDSRASYNQIADQYFDLRINGSPKVDVMLGGGQEYYIRSDRNLVKEFVDLGYQYQDDINNLKLLTKAPALGLFAPTGMKSAIDSDHPLRLAEMTEKALELLQEKPFFLLLEASQIDWCAHANDIACAMAEMHDMAETMKIIKRFIDANPNTIFVATADHSTGGLSISANGEFNQRGEYMWLSNVVKKIKASGPVIAERLVNNKAQWQDEWKALTSLPLSPQETQKIQQALDAVTPARSKEEMMRVQSLVLASIDYYSCTGWTSSGHTGEDVQVFSYGKNKNNFAGAQDNIDIAKKLFTYINP
ncbi:MAG TPA: alkaline phosphatase [Cellvibrio sp.]|nr:alkaline phosphatase [Cellvibrio sp.]